MDGKEARMRADRAVTPTRDHWPEFFDLCDRLGVPADPTRETVIRLCCKDEKDRAVYRSEDFKEFCRICGIPWHLRTREIVIRYAPFEFPRVEHYYHVCTLPESEKK